MPGVRFLVVLIAALVSVPPAAAEIQEYSEDFRDWLQRDPAFTTALWDTVAGELRLPPQPLGARGSLNTLGTAYLVARLGTHLLVADGTGGLLAIDPANPDQPLQVDQLTLADQARSLAVAGSWAYVAVGAAGLQAVNVANPADLSASGVADGPGYAQGVALAGGWAYVAQGVAGVGVYDLAAPGAPSHGVDLPAGDFVRGLAVGGGRLLAADGTRGLKVYSLANPALPARVDSLDTPGNCQGVALAGSLAFLADGAAGLQVVDLDTGGRAAVVAGLALPGTAMSVTVAGDTLLIAGGDGGLHLVDVSVPTMPVLVGTAPSLNWAYQALAMGTGIWLADGAAGLRAFTADPHGLDENADAARSLDLNPGPDPVLRARLSADYEDSVLFFLSGNGGSTWTPVAADGSWFDFPTPTLDVRWRVRLAVADGWPGPVVRSLTLGLDRSVSHAVITGVTDVPGDTGGQVRLRWLASRHDAAGAPYVVTGYSVYRRIDAGKRWPAGEWEYLLTVPADREAEYASIAPTLHDATPDDPAWSVYFVRTRTAVPGVFFDSQPDSGQSLDDLRPAAPTGFVVDRSDGQATALSWDPSPEPDFAHFRLYRSQDGSLPPGPLTLWQVTAATSWLDPTAGFWHYDLTVVDTRGRESLPATAVSAVPAAVGGLQLGPATPNPSNPATAVHFTVPATGARVRIAVHDARGRLVRVLADGWFGGGPQVRIWDGRDQQGRAAASGVYTVRLDGAGRQKSLKLTMVR